MEPIYLLIKNYISQIDHSIVLVLGIATIIPFFAGRLAGRLRLPSIVGYMVIGLFLGPSFLNVISDHSLKSLNIITEIILGFVALNIGLELKFKELKSQGLGILVVILTESFGAFLLVFFGIYLLTDSIPLALIFGAIAPASAPAGTVAVIKEYKAKGKLTKALYAVVGFDDGLGIMIFGISASIAKALIIHQNESYSSFITEAFFHSLKEIGLSILVGIVFALILCFILQRKRYIKSMLVFVFGFVLMVVGLCELTHLSLILSNMVFGIVVTNMKKDTVAKELGNQLYQILPLFFVLFFTIAGAHLQVSLISSLGAIAIVYIIGRTVGLWSGAYFGARLGKLDDSIKKYLGMGILSQAGVAIGLSLIVKQDFHNVGPIIDKVSNISLGDSIGTTVFATITGTCLFFEIIGPILAKVALQKAGEVNMADEAGLEAEINESAEVLIVEEKQLHTSREINVGAGLSQVSKLKTIKDIDKEVRNLIQREIEVSPWEILKALKNKKTKN